MPTFDSFDHVEDALDVLDKSNFPYVLILMADPKHIKVYSALHGNVEAFAEILGHSTLDEYLKEHLGDHYPNE